MLRSKKLRRSILPSETIFVYQIMNLACSNSIRAYCPWDMLWSAHIDFFRFSLVFFFNENIDHIRWIYEAFFMLPTVYRQFCSLPTIHIFTSVSVAFFVEKLFLFHNTILNSTTDCKFCVGNKFLLMKTI